MKRYWLYIRIGNKEIKPILIFDGYSACTALSMKSLSCVINSLHITSDILIEFEYIEDNNETKRLVYKDSISLIKRNNIVDAFLGNILRGNATNKVTVEIFFNQTEEGLCVGFLSNKFKPTKYIVNNKYRREEIVKQEQQISDILSAKTIFILNHHVFSDLLVSIDTKTMNNEYISQWEQRINSLSNSSDLLLVFNKYKNDFSAWIKLLLSWGLKKDGCKQYPGLLVNLDRYNLAENNRINPSANYQVISPCWTIWIEQNGIKTEKIVSKGILKMI